MTGSLFDTLLGLLALAGNSAPEVGGTLLSFLFMGVIVLRNALSPLFGLLFRARPQRLRRQCGEVVVLIALTFACWLVPLSAIIDAQPLPFLVFAGLTFVITVVAIARLMRLVGSVGSFAMAHTAAAIIPERKPAPLVADYQDVPARPIHTGPIQSAVSPSQRIGAGLKNGTLLQWAPFAAGLVVMVVSGVLFGALDGSLDNHPIDTAAVVQAGANVGHNTDDVFGTLRSTFGIMLCALTVGGLFLLGVSRFAARRNLRYDNDPLDALARQIRRGPQP